LPAHCTAVGKILLSSLDPSDLDALLAAGDLAGMTPQSITDKDRLRAELDRVRAEDVAVDDGESTNAVRCVGAPVRDHTAQVIGAISLSTIREFYDPETTGPAVRDAALEISNSMGWNGNLYELFTAPPGSLEEILGVDHGRRPSART
jgi:DNA-binding IclR family transcriptional regulator